MVRVELTEDTAERFKEFLEHQELFEALLLARIFNVHSGKVIVDFDAEGMVQQVTTECVAFRRRKLA